MTTEELYLRAEQEGIGVLSIHADKKAVCLDNGIYKLIGMNYKKIGSMREERVILAEELVHLDNGYLYKVKNINNPAYKTVISHAEQQTRDAVARMFIPFDALHTAVTTYGYREVWELANYFDVPESTVMDAIQYYISMGLEIRIEEEC